MADTKNVFISHVHEDDAGLGKLKELRLLPQALACTWPACISHKKGLARTHYRNEQHIAGAVPHMLFNCRHDTAHLAVKAQEDGVQIVFVEDVGIGNASKIVREDRRPASHYKAFCPADPLDSSEGEARLHRIWSLNDLLWVLPLERERQL